VISAQFKKPFAEQWDFFRQKLNLPVADWRDLPGAYNDAAFFASGFLKADMIASLRAAVDQVIADGKSLAWFRDQFDGIVERAGWAKPGTKFGDANYRDWRARIVYQTNMATSYSAGRWAQLNNPELLARAPYWMYRHSDAVASPRPLHLSWNYVTKLATDPWWQTHYTPNGWGCQCYVIAVSKADAERMGGKFGPAPGEGKTYQSTDRKTGEVLTLPVGVDRGWDYAPGATAAARAMGVAADKALGYDAELGSRFLEMLRQSPAFSAFFARSRQSADNWERWPIAMLPAADAAALAVERGVVLLSRTTLFEHLAKHPEISIADYRDVQRIMVDGDVYRDGEGRLAYFLPLGDGYEYFLAIKRDGERIERFLMTLFRMSGDKAAANQAKPGERLRGSGGG
jgi:hypothetical protein